MIHGIHHINIHTPDLDRALAFYTQAFGFEVVFEHYLEDFADFVHRSTGVEGAAARVVTLRAANTFVELFQWTSPQGRPINPLRPYDFGFTHIAIAVDDIEATYRRLADDLGVEFVYPSPQQVELNGGVYGSVYGKDPDGNIIELTQIPDGDDMSLGSLG